MIGLGNVRKSFAFEVAYILFGIDLEDIWKLANSNYLSGISC